MIPKKNRLNSNQVAQTKADGVPRKTPSFTVIVSSSGDHESRFGIIITKKLAPLAITRNALKRAIYKTIKDVVADIPSANYLIVPKITTLSPTHQQELIQALKAS